MDGCVWQRHAGRSLLQTDTPVAGHGHALSGKQTGGCTNSTKLWNWGEHALCGQRSERGPYSAVTGAGSTEGSIIAVPMREHQDAEASAVSMREGCDVFGDAKPFENLIGTTGVLPIVVAEAIPEAIARELRNVMPLGRVRCLASFKPPPSLRRIPRKPKCAVLSFCGLPRNRWECRDRTVGFPTKARSILTNLSGSSDADSI